MFLHLTLNVSNESLNQTPVLYQTLVSKLVKLQLKVQNKSIVKIKISEKLILRKNKISPLLKPPEKDFHGYPKVVSGVST